MPRSFVHDGPGRPYYTAYREAFNRRARRTGQNTIPTWKRLKPWQVAIWNEMATEASKFEHGLHLADVVA